MKPPVSQTHKRHDLGVIIRWEIATDGNIFITEQFRHNVTCTICNKSNCKHAKLAAQLEQEWQLKNTGEEPGRCFFCNRLAPKRNGIAICHRCIS